MHELVAGPQEYASQNNVVLRHRTTWVSSVAPQLMAPSSVSSSSTSNSCGGRFGGGSCGLQLGEHGGEHILEKRLQGCVLAKEETTTAVKRHTLVSEPSSSRPLPMPRSMRGSKPSKESACGTAGPAARHNGHFSIAVSPEASAEPLDSPNRGRTQLTQKRCPQGNRAGSTIPPRQMAHGSSSSGLPTPSPRRSIASPSA
eukprot:CAMPEP_0177297596 /NCGR_PEP_ID=MMETSP0368-20130122/3041_1 /TAXON_ID=447022 ORGANISM="Scrippsiella hangoei-like, Strain SHHI-4" /NCGR_SAMPLE_ID=MMETSP0368 /ASSEMBLY_ACC=CAM_ASM_000363 /LENGTH=199 /DNA_ID=CAMNT_0018755801 /DNA_START=290 /DNA_END=887 /DNA_ORIENTATION=-